jgi:hypothetical protein
VINKGLIVKYSRTLLRVFTLTLVLGLILWSVQLRFIQVGSHDKTSYVIVLLSDVDEGSEVVFQYPHAESPFYVGRVSQFIKNKGFLLETEQDVHIPRELILGPVLYEF